MRSWNDNQRCCCWVIVLSKALFFQGLSFKKPISVTLLDSLLVACLFCSEPGFTLHCRSDVRQAFPSGLWMKKLTVPSAGCWQACVNMYCVFKSMFQLPRRDPPRPHLLLFVLFRCVLTYFVLIRSLFSFFFSLKQPWSATTRGQMNGRMLPKWMSHTTATRGRSTVATCIFQVRPTWWSLCRCAQRVDSRSDVPEGFTCLTKSFFLDGITRFSSPEFAWELW